VVVPAVTEELVVVVVVVAIVVAAVVTVVAMEVLAGFLVVPRLIPGSSSGRAKLTVPEELLCTRYRMPLPPYQRCEFFNCFTPPASK